MAENTIEKGHDKAKNTKKAKNKNKTNKVIESVCGPHQSVRLARNCIETFLVASHVKTDITVN